MIDWQWGAANLQNSELEQYLDPGVGECLGAGSFKQVWASACGHWAIKVMKEEHMYDEMEAYDTLCQLDADALLPVMAWGVVTAKCDIKGEWSGFGVIVQPLCIPGNEMPGAYNDERASEEERAGWRAIADFADEYGERGWCDLCTSNCGWYQGRPVVLDYGGHNLDEMRNEAC